MAKKIRLFFCSLIFLIIIFVVNAMAWEITNIDDDFIYVKVNKQDLKEISKYKMMVVAICRVNKFDEKNFWAHRVLKIPKDFEKGLQWSPLPLNYESAKSREKYVLISIKEQFLGCYEYGILKKSFPISSGVKNNPTPIGKFRIFAKHIDHKSDVYKDERGRPIKMPWAIAFHIGFYDGQWIVTWIHAGELPGYRASHGCVRLFEKDAKTLFLWLFSDTKSRKYEYVENGPPVEIITSIRQ